LAGTAPGRSFVAAALLALCICAFGPAVARADGPTINVVYSSSSVTVSVVGGSSVGNGTTIPAGSYTIQVYDGGDWPNPKFTMSGPGVSVSSDLNSTGMGIDNPSTFGPFNLATSSSYTISDANMGGGSRVAFSTSATATATGGSSLGGSGSTSVSGSGSSSGSSSSSAGSTTHMVGTATGSVSAAGKPTFSFAGKPVRTLAPGLYKVTVADHSKKAGFILGRLGAKPITVSSAAAVGTSSHPVTLARGKWYVEVAVGGPRVYFTVS
jgi:hypothetical protein